MRFEWDIKHLEWHLAQTVLGVFIIVVVGLLPAWLSWAVSAGLALILLGPVPAVGTLEP